MLSLTFSVRLLKQNWTFTKHPPIIRSDLNSRPLGMRPKHCTWPDLFTSIYVTFCLPGWDSNPGTSNLYRGQIIIIRNVAECFLLHWSEILSSLSLNWRIKCRYNNNTPRINTAKLLLPSLNCCKIEAIFWCIV